MTRDKRQSDCGCWTDTDGYWQLSDACRQAEFDTWKNAVNKYRGQDLVDWVSNLVPTTPHEQAVRYFRQELYKK